MIIQGSQTLAAPCDQVWAVLMENGRFPPPLSPDFKLLEAVGENHYRGVLNVAVGPLRGKYEGWLTISEVETPVSFRVDFDGRGQKGGMTGYGRIHLAPHNRQTIIRYEGEIQADGQLTALVPRLLHANINAVIRRAFVGIRRALGLEQPLPGTPRTPHDNQLTSWPHTLIMIGLLLVGTLLIGSKLKRKIRSDNSK